MHFFVLLDTTGPPSSKHLHHKIHLGCLNGYEKVGDVRWHQTNRKGKTVTSSIITAVKLFIYSQSSYDVSDRNLIEQQHQQLPLFHLQNLIWLLAKNAWSTSSFAMIQQLDAKFMVSGQKRYQISPLPPSPSLSITVQSGVMYTVLSHLIADGAVFRI